ncbi:MAG: hypothetical protein AW08_03106 [Candidatus Accumulibacter adjunctus]|uniref:Uncharacterized protein n=1 Tax=Candidatus Accumulibacter adjunctus TaxID=1454001 RepID=A0A011MSQ1_9PROT|nr:MAG: hypothetical protein AW08_03106 [Candidatus Accumulibacter adjunctus]
MAASGRAHRPNGSWLCQTLVQVNPNFRSGHSVDQPVAAGSLHAECARIFRVGKGAASADTSLQLFKYQEEAIGFAQTGACYVQTTGSGASRGFAAQTPCTLPSRRIWAFADSLPWIAGSASTHCASA